MRNISRTALATLALVALVTAGCSKLSNPAAPSPSSQVPSGSSGAVIQGVVLGGSASARSAASTGGGMTVTVVGTNITVSIGLTGQFTITGVPSGDITLKFHGNMGDATITITQVTQGETINITVTIQGTTATTETEVRDDSQGNLQVEGRIESINATAGTIVVSGKTITTDANTVIRHGNDSGYKVADLMVGWRVHVAGTAAAGGVLAKTIMVQNVNGDIGVNVNGIVQALEGTATAFQFTVDGRLVKGDSGTTFSGKNNSFAALKNGVRVEVKGQMKDGYVYAASIHVNS